MISNTAMNRRDYRPTNVSPSVLLIVSILVEPFAGCSNGTGAHSHLAESNTKLVYFGFTDHSETQQDAVRLADIWGHDKVCAHWRPTVSEKEADYRVLFGSSGDVTILGHRGEVLYTGGEGVLYLPHGNPDGSGVNICKLTGE
jgi:hypothetical protein